MGAPFTFKVLTLGCKVNQYESAFLEECLKDAGLRKTLPGETAKLVVINTCTVTAEASHQCRQTIRRAMRENPGALVAAVGCYVQAFPEELMDIEGLWLASGNKSKKDVPVLLLEALRAGSGLTRGIAAFEKDEHFESMPVMKFSNRARAFLKIQDGCDGLCSYCIVPRARGPSRSLPPAEVLSGLRRMAEGGCREVVLTGIHLGRYGADLNPPLSLLHLMELIGNLALPLRIRLSSIEPKEVERGLISMVRRESWLCKHFHIPLQSGDTNILKAMNRDYEPDEFASLLEDIRSLIPLAAIGTDVISGFPGETEKAHENTMSLLQRLPVTYLHVFPFSPRKGTSAAAMQGFPHPSIRKQRTSELRALGLAKKSCFQNACIGSRLEVVYEGPSKDHRGFIRGTTDNYLNVISPAESIPRIKAVTLVRIEKSLGSSMLAIPVSPSFPV